MSKQIAINEFDQGIVNPIEVSNLSVKQTFIIKEQFPILYATNTHASLNCTFNIKGIRDEIIVEGYGHLDVSKGIDIEIAASDTLMIDIKQIYKQLGDYGDTATVTPITNGECVNLWMTE